MNWIGLALSFGFVFAVLGVAEVLLKHRLVTAPVSRKIVHISVAHWWFLAMTFFTRWEFAIVGPVVFIILNYASYRKKIFTAMEAAGGGTLGTVYFPVALLIAVLASWAGPVPIWVAGMGILVMGWGDGLAALLGENNARSHVTIFGSQKSVLGTLTMLLASAAVVTFFVFVLGPGPSVRAVAAIIATSFLATFVELLTPWGVDNLTVPLLTAGFYYVVFA
jgi:phytol kinase